MSEKSINQNKRIERALADLGSEHQPPDGWQARVLDAAAKPPRRRWRGKLVALALAAGAVVLFVLWLVGLV